MEVFAVLQAVTLAPFAVAAQRDLLGVGQIGGLVVVSQKQQSLAVRGQLSLQPRAVFSRRTLCDVGNVCDRAGDLLAVRPQAQ